MATFSEFLKLYGVEKEDLKDITSLYPYFSAEFKKNLGEKLKEFAIKNLPKSADIITKGYVSSAFTGTI